MWKQRVTDLHDVFDQRLVGADLSPLQPADVLPDPGDEGELGSFAHGVSRRDPNKPEQTSIIWFGREVRGDID